MNVQTHTGRFLIIGFLLSLPATSPASGDGGQAGAFLQYNMGSRALGMGRAYVAVADDAGAVFWNPAGMVNASRMEFSSMYTNLFYDSRYASAGLVLPRPKQRVDNPILRYLIGPGSAFGFGWVGLHMAGFDQRTETGQFLGRFDYGENGFLASWAHEHVNSWAAFQYGFSLKSVNQRFPGLASSEAVPMDGSAQWSHGMDAGLMIQPIHFPILRIIALRYLLPLRIGVSVQNAVQPQWSAAAEDRDLFPRIVRTGLSYRVHFRDWIPESWASVYNGLYGASVLLAFDRETMENREAGLFFGGEGRFPLFGTGALLSPRFGVNNRTDGASLGLGFSVPFTETAEISLDYAMGFHPYLSEDSRFFITLRFGGKRDAGFFQKLADDEAASSGQIRENLLRIMASYPNDRVEQSVLRLAEMGDSTYAGRYYELVSGLSRARWLLSEARMRMREQEHAEGRRKAFEASTEYAPIFLKPDNTLSEQDLMDFGEVLIYAGLADDAVMVMREVEPESLEAHFWTGIARKQAGDVDAALESFRQAVQQYEQEGDKRSLVCLSLLNIGEILIRKRQYDSARMTFETILKNYTGALKSDYPRFRIYRDDRCQDDAQYLLGIAQILNESYLNGLADLAGGIRYYPAQEYGLAADAAMDRLVEMAYREDWTGLREAAGSLFEAYLDAHDLSVQ